MSYRIGSVRFGSVQLAPVRCDSVRFVPFRSVRLAYSAGDLVYGGWLGC